MDKDFTKKKISPFFFVEVTAMTQRKKRNHFDLDFVNIREWF
jgi:hypothetical protein